MGMLDIPGVRNRFDVKAAMLSKLVQVVQPMDLLYLSV